MRTNMPKQIPLKCKLHRQWLRISDSDKICFSKAFESIGGKWSLFLCWSTALCMCGLRLHCVSRSCRTWTRAQLGLGCCRNLQLLGLHTGWVRTPAASFLSFFFFLLPFFFLSIDCVLYSMRFSCRNISNIHIRALASLLQAVLCKERSVTHEEWLTHVDASLWDHCRWPNSSKLSSSVNNLQPFVMKKKNTFWGIHFMRLVPIQLSVICLLWRIRQT